MPMHYGPGLLPHIPSFDEAQALETMGSLMLQTRTDFKVREVIGDRVAEWEADVKTFTANPDDLRYDQRWLPPEEAEPIIRWVKENESGQAPRSWGEFISDDFTALLPGRDMPLGLFEIPAAEGTCHVVCQWHEWGIRRMQKVNAEIGGNPKFADAFQLHEKLIALAEGCRERSLILGFSY